MKKYLLILLLALSTSICGAQSFDDLKRTQITQSPNVAYRLYPTFNSWIFLKLDTRNGRIWLVQYSINGSSSRFEDVLSNKMLAQTNEENIGRFTLYPTSNYYNFILVDQFEGATYQVQWGTKSSDYSMWPINSYGNEIKYSQSSNVDYGDTSTEENNYPVDIDDQDLKDIILTDNEEDVARLEFVSMIKGVSVSSSGAYGDRLKSAKRNLKINARASGGSIVFIMDCTPNTPGLDYPVEVNGILYKKK